MQVMGKTADGQRRILKWTYDGGSYQNMPTGVIFVPTGQNQTADLVFHNHGYYIEGVYDHTVSTEPSTLNSPLSTLHSQPSIIYDLQGRRLSAPPAHGLYIQNGRKVRK